MAERVFISYRRDDSRHAAGRIVGRLETAFSSDRLFMDIDGIDLGLDFVEVLNEQLEQCVAILVIIGPGWLNARDKAGNRRLDDPNDPVRIEVETALKRNIRVMPVLIDGATLPAPGELPESLQPLLRRQAARVTHETFGGDVDAIVAALQRVFSASQVAKPSSGPPIRTPGSVSRDMIMKVAIEIGPLENCYLAPSIPLKKLQNARASTGLPMSVEVLVLFDDSMSGSAKDCLLVCSDGLYCKLPFASAEFVGWDEFLSAPIVEGMWIGLKVGQKSWTFGFVRSAAANFLRVLQSNILNAMPAA